MEKIKRAYYYLFYKLYKWYEKAPVVWWSDWKAVVSIVALEIWFLLSIGTYFSVFTKKTIELTVTHPIVFIPTVSIILVNYLIFIHTDKWKDIVKEFDQLPKRTNKIGGWIVFGVILLIVANLIFAFYQMSLID